MLEVIALGEFFTPEELKQASMPSTNKAFERYFRVKPETVRNIYEAGRDEERFKGEKGKKRVLNFPRKSHPT